MPHDYDGQVQTHVSITALHFPPAKNLADPMTIREASDLFIEAEAAAGRPVALVAGRRHLPKAQDLFDLATDSVVGSPELLPLRLRTARHMAGQSSEGMRVAVKATTPGSAKARCTHYETGERPPPTSLFGNWAKYCHVPKDWLVAGGRRLEGNYHEWMPIWLWPWHDAVIEAKAMIRGYEGDRLPYYIVDGSSDPKELRHQINLLAMDYGMAARRRCEEDNRMDSPAYYRPWDSIVAALEAVLRACGRASGRADIWTRLAYGQPC